MTRVSCQLAHSEQASWEQCDCRWMLGSRPKVIPMALGIVFQKQPTGCQIWRNTCSVLGPAWAAHLPCHGKANAQTSSAGSSQTPLPLREEKERLKIEAAHPHRQQRTPRPWASPSRHFVRPRKGGLRGWNFQLPQMECFLSWTWQKNEQALGSERAGFEGLLFPQNTEKTRVVFAVGFGCFCLMSRKGWI